MKKIFILLLITVVGNSAIIFGQNTVLFDSYTSKFREVKTATIDNDFLRSKNEIASEFVKLFIKHKPDCGCDIENLWYQYGSIIKSKDFILCFIYKNCDIPSSSGNYPYSEIILMVYSPKGEIIDSSIISRGGDLWQANFRGSITPFRLIVEQASISKKEFEKTKAYPMFCKINTYEYFITEKGEVKQKIISKDKGTIIWDKKKNKSLIVKDNN